MHEIVCSAFCKMCETYMCLQLLLNLIVIFSVTGIFVIFSVTGIAVKLKRQDGSSQGKWFLVWVATSQWWQCCQSCDAEHRPGVDDGMC